MNKSLWNQIVVSIIVYSILTTSSFAQMEMGSSPNLPSGGAPPPFTEGFRGGLTLGQKRPSIGVTSQPSGLGVSNFNLEVNVVGAVVQPGTYRMPALARVTDALAMAGNLLPEGSNRRVAIRGQGNHNREVDLLKFYFEGSLSDNPYIQDHDVILIPLKTMAVKIYGPVSRPGDYGLKNEETISQLTKLLGGYTTGYDPGGEFRISRIDKSSKNLLRIPAKDIDHFKLQHGDVILVPHINRGQVDYTVQVRDLPGESVIYPELEQKVFVVGSVIVPGGFDYYPHLTIQEYIAMAGGARPMAKLKKVTVLNRQLGVSYVDLTKNTSQVRINPGDVIELKENVIPPQFWISFLATVTSIGLSAVAIFSD